MATTMDTDAVKKALTRDDLFGARIRRRVSVPQLDGVVYAQPIPYGIAEAFLTQASRDGENSELSGAVAVGPMLGQLLVWGVVDEQGDRIFSENDVDRIRDELPFAIASPLATAVLEVSGLTDTAATEFEGN